MDRGAWQAARVRHDLVTKPSPQEALVVKNWPASAGDTRDKVQSLGPEDPLEEGMATHSIILAWRISVDGGAWQPTVQQVTKSQTRLKQLSKHTGICFCVSVPYLHS